MTAKNEYPRPQFVRPTWQNLNGCWQFAFDDENQGLNQKWYLSDEAFGREIQVPFVYQCELSGINEKEPHDIVWYRRIFTVENRKDRDNVILHFGAVDYQAKVFVNGYLAGEHEGGHTSFSFDITPFLKDGEQVITLRVYDPTEDESIPRGKQFWEKKPRGIWYTGSTGIWQTVWLECVSQTRIDNVKFTSLFEDGKENIKCKLQGLQGGESLEYQIRFRENVICEGSVKCFAEKMSWDVDLIQEHIFRTNFHDNGWTWTPEHPNLFDVSLCLKNLDGVILDKVETYFGFRKVHQEKGMVYLNNKPYYQKLVLDQGYWPQGLMTAPSDEDLKKDIELSKEMGFNGCRKHQKMEEARFLYWADKLGYLVWGECASTPMYSPKAAERTMKEWAEAVERDYNHPSIVVWVPLNESWGIPTVHRDSRQKHFSQTMYHYLHALDDTRLVISNDGWDMTETDICAIHNYMHGQKEEVDKYNCYKNTLSTRENLVTSPSTCWDIYAEGFSHRGEPIILTEFGGIGFEMAGEGAWGYTSASNEQEFLEDYERIMKAVMESKALYGYCYTQLSDVEQEMNGLLTYDRKPKCSLEKIRRINMMYHNDRINA
ncbi:MAG: glycoside hydrolase family 2 TIM barrel-domain containing protein [Blautia sp.]|nr:glycoside hydrolase family 2 TIM barrel-domain containing protein [Blautia sp.]